MPVYAAARSRPALPAIAPHDIPSAAGEAGAADALSDAMCDPIPEAVLQPTSGLEMGVSPARRARVMSSRHTGTSNAPAVSLDEHSTPPRLHSQPVEDRSPEALLAQSLLVGAGSRATARAPALAQRASDGSRADRAAPGLPPAPRSATSVLGEALPVGKESSEVSSLGSPEVQPSRARAGMLSDMPSRDPRHAGLLATSTKGVAAVTCGGLGLSGVAPHGLPDQGCLHAGADVGVAQERPTEGTSMLATMFGSRPPGLSAAGCLAPVALPQQGMIREAVHSGNGGLDPGGRPGAQFVAVDAQSGMADVRGCDNLEQPHDVQQAAAVSVRRPGHDPPGEMGAIDGEAQDRDQGVADGEVVAPLAAQLAKLYC